MKPNYKIENIQKTILNGKPVKLFSAFKYRDGAYIHIGSFAAPARVADKNLDRYISR